MYRKLFGNENQRVAGVLYELASTLAHQDKSLAEAENLSRQALAIQRKVLDNEHPEIARSVYMLAIALSFKGGRSKGKPGFREVLAMWRKLQANERPEFAEALHNLAYMLMQQGKVGEAEPCFARPWRCAGNCSATSTRTWLIRCTNWLSWSFSKAERLKPKRSLARNGDPEEIANERLCRVGQRGVQPGYMLMQQGKLAEAEIMFRESLAGRRRLFGNEHQEVADSLHKLAKMALEQGRPAEAETFCRQELAMQRKLRTNDCIELSQCAERTRLRAHTTKQTARGRNHAPRGGGDV